MSFRLEVSHGCVQANGLSPECVLRCFLRFLASEKPFCKWFLGLWKAKVEGVMGYILDSSMIDCTVHPEA